ncbi:MAG TPA: PIN domain-containing protein [Acidimicrobiales bacterium]|nr:PIN domain-containing protein [Acidimicrobiales bacterium]
MARYTAVLDTCVLVPVILADTLLRLAEDGLFRPLWSSRIIGEAADAIARVHPGEPATRVAARLEAMNGAFEDALVVGWETVEDTITLPDPDDRHVVAAAVVGRADAIVTANVNDFPAAVVDPLGIEIIHPDAFLLDQLDLAPRRVVDVIRRQAAATRRPALTDDDVIARLARAGVPAFASEVARVK